MYSIPNSQRAELIKLLAALTTLPGTDPREANLRRRARLVIGKLNNAKKIKRWTAG